MKRRLVLLLLLGSMLAYTNSVVHATSWAMLAPEEVEQRATLVVSGSYIFNGNNRRTSSLWSPTGFQVDKVHKGAAEASLTVGIDMYDEGWVGNHQLSGGSFLLFLEMDDDGLLVPVGGPNGMIQIMNGTLSHHQPESAAFYEAFLQQNPGTAPEPSQQQGNPGQPRVSLYLMAAGAVALSGLAGGLVYTRTTRTKKQQ